MSQLFSREEVARRTGKHDAAIIIDNVVYCVVEWLDDHPGGHEVLLANAGKDASQCFHDIGHSEEAKLLRAKFKIGEVVEEDKWEVIQPRKLPLAADAGHSPLSLLDVWAPPLVLATVALIVYWYLFL